MPASVSLVADLRPVTRCVQRRLSEGDAGFAAMVEELKASDLVIANLETPLSKRGKPVPKFRNLRSDPEVIQDVKALGVHVVTLANNHMMDYGPGALADTLRTCDEGGVARCGAGLDLEEAFRPLTFDIRGRRIGLLNLASTVPMGFDAGPGRPGLAPLRVDFAFEFDKPRPYMERKSFILKAMWGDRPVIELVPLFHDERGVPSRAFGAEAKAVQDRLVDLSTPFGTKLAIEGDKAYLKLT